MAHSSMKYSLEMMYINGERRYLGVREWKEMYMPNNLGSDLPVVTRVSSMPDPLPSWLGWI